MYRKFYRSRKNRLLAGVCGGIGEYFNIDPTIVRILWVLISLNGIGIAAYIICAIIIPDEDFSDSQSSGQFNDTKYNFNPEKTSLIIGGIFVAIGVILIGRRYFYWLDKYLWPLAIIVLGIVIIINGRRKQ